MSDWITSGADAPWMRGTQQKHRDRRRLWRITATSAIAAGLLSLMLHSVAARDRGQFAGASPELKSWFDSLRSAKGPCCSDADGSAVSDVDWESRGGHYRVRLDGVWLDVPDEAVLTGPNRVGRTMVWPQVGTGGTSIRCFLPGSMT
ncbi:hypothetical protein [Tardiphaga sp.]|uniref:hypothetical protein n=1 Tax=Tardiphaga sp. TaxID=1926292 RepID=UPI0026037AE1|nr:hypothetical protein [Tardiphaga sp.]MDB5621192.1 putative exported protein of unknown function [Tardiphaga sp.]